MVLDSTSKQDFSTSTSLEVSSHRQSAGLMHPSLPADAVVAVVMATAAKTTEDTIIFFNMGNLGWFLGGNRRGAR